MTNQSQIKLTPGQNEQLRRSFINEATATWIYGPYMTRSMCSQLIRKGLLVINERGQRALTDTAKQLHTELGFSGREL